jgi:hypothetical protein
MRSITTIRAQENDPTKAGRCAGLMQLQAPVNRSVNRLSSGFERAIAMAERQDHEQESRRILERVARETAPGSTPFVVRAAKDARDHMTAADADRADPIEYWGTRVGRTLGFIIAIGLLVWLVYAATRSG